MNLRLVATLPGARPDLFEPVAVAGGAVVGRREVLVDGGLVHAAVLDRTRMGRGSRVPGPAVVEFPEATCLVRPEWSGVVDDFGTLVLTRESADEETKE
ncbi:MAG TPA: hypothetical protein VFC16_03785 [Nakamurella sp.]|nr:hypothetical protein [Nakamurella sp.]